MQCYIYHAEYRDGYYLYIRQRDDFGTVPEDLLRRLGPLRFAMTLDLASRERLANADITQVKQGLVEQGFYLQLPPDEDLSQA